MLSRRLRRRWWIERSLDDIARARGMTQVADVAGLTRPGLYKALKPGAKTGFVTLRKLVGALGLKMIFVPASHVDVAKPPKLRSAAAAIRAKRAVRRSGEG
jgi:hypothetical protein